MAKQKVECLMCELHEFFGDDQPSPQQQKLMDELEAHIHSVLEPEITDPTPIDTIEYLVEELKGQHPKATSVVREILSTLRNIGV